ncbi:D-2-hydroxyacid dehydrogenase [Mycobacterium spongiae]|uniref:D-2-hydroxyacid dehydrogenase n=1 Tax=Mycobacterium spongiae TaxID=886343 RepID=A0A975JY05_9MYCO|nr:D-2-hydroxyacid dehydrogenase [Mycobacterium spongiae]QUR67806.1 D-2-hydroxyacid dehydrogenase [Mycobacterium spongiae]
MPDEPVVVAIMFPAAWDHRPATALAADIARLKSISPRIQVIDERYTDSDAVRLRRGQDPSADLRDQQAPLTDRQREVLAQAEVILAQDLPFDVADLAPRLRWVQGVGAGVSQLQSAGVPNGSVRLTTAAGANSVAIAEFVFARILQIVKRLPEIDTLAREHVWRPTYGSQLAGRSLTVVGLGSIGRRVAILARAFGMHVKAVRQSAQTGATDRDVDEVFGAADLVSAVTGSAVVVAAVPETPDTRDLFNAKIFGAMSGGSVFINVGRGSAVDEDDLVKALSDGHLAAAALDVVKNEPLPAAAELWAAPNLYLSPHSAATADEHWRNVFALFGANLENYLNGEPLVNQVPSV